MKIKNKFSYSWLLAVFVLSNELRALNYPPKFERIAMVVVAANNKCGSFSLKIKPGVPSVKIKVERIGFTYGGGYTRKKIARLMAKTELPADEQMTVAYDSAGSGAHDHYRLLCYGANNKPVNCSDVIDIQSITHNVHCSKIDSPFAPLNMNQGAPGIKTYFYPLRSDIPFRRESHE